MANSTFSGPVRSQNGFQELVDGVWTPIGGGGGEAILVPFRSDGDDTVYVQTAFTQAGQMKTITSSWPEIGTISGEIIIELLKSPTAQQIVVVGTFVLAGDTPTGIVESGGDSIFFSFNSPFQMKLTYLGTWKESPSEFDPITDIYYIELTQIPLGG